MADYVFIGPSLAAAEARRLLPAATFLPPIQHGDLLRLGPEAGDRVLIIDGLFMRTPPVRHREILAMLDRGVHVAGSSSMGALRASELCRYGMRGVGRVFELYRDGVVTGDDEVAVVHASADDGYACLSEPLVNLRVALAEAVDAGQLTSAEADTLLALGRSLPFRLRGPRALERAARDAFTDDRIDRYLRWIDEHPRDAKADDARLLLSLAADGAPELTEREHDLRPIEHVETIEFERWRGRHGGARVGDRWVPDTSTVVALMALHPDFPTLHRRRTLAELSGADPAAPDADLARAALGVARERGLLLGTTTDLVPAPTWLVESERRLPAEEATLRILVRAFGTRACTALSARALPPTLLEPDIVAQSRRFVQAALRLTDRLPRPDPHRPHLRLGFRTEVIDQTFGRLWGATTGELTAAAWDRGFGDLTQLHRYAGPLMAMLKVVGPPQFRRP